MNRTNEATDADLKVIAELTRCRGRGHGREIKRGGGDQESVLLGGRLAVTEGTATPPGASATIPIGSRRTCSHDPAYTIQRVACGRAPVGAFT